MRAAGDGSAGIAIDARIGRAIPCAIIAAVFLALTLPTTIGIAADVGPAADYIVYRDAVARWLAGGTFYEPWQLGGPYHLVHGAVLYPPVTLWLLVPAVALPTAVWWIVPALVVAWSVRRIRPRPLVWPFLALLIGFSPLPVLVQAVNPSLWIIAAAWAGAAIVGPSVLVLMKPSFGPFAFFGAWHRRWWAWAAVFALACLPFGGMWLDWLRVLRDGDGSVFYSFREYGLLLAPAVAWLGRSPRR